MLNKEPTNPATYCIKHKYTSKNKEIQLYNSRYQQLFEKGETNYYLSGKRVKTIKKVRW